MPSALDSGPTILVVEDDSTLASLLRDLFQDKGYSVWIAETGAAAKKIADEIHPDLSLVDLMLPDMHGLVLCANLKEKLGTPVIICSGTKRKDDAVIGLKLGAVDFIAKPFSVDELETRVEAVLKHAPPSAACPARQAGMQCLGPLVIDQARCSVALNGEELHLTPTEYRLLCALMCRPNQVLAREELAGHVWSSYDGAIGRSLEVHLRRLRGKLLTSPQPSPTLKVVRGFGYQLAWDPLALHL